MSLCCDAFAFVLVAIPASILYKSIAGRYRLVSYPDGPITARYRFIKNAYSDPTINICGRAHRGPVCGFVFWLRVTIKPFALFHDGVFDMYFTVRFHKCGRGPLRGPNIYL